MPSPWLTLLTVMSICVLTTSGAMAKCGRLNRFGVKFVQPQGERDCFTLLPSGNKTWSEELCRRLTHSAGRLFGFSQPSKDTHIVKALGLNNLKGLVWTPAVTTSNGTWSYPDGTALSTTLRSKPDQCLAVFLPHTFNHAFKYGTRLCWREFPAVCRVTADKVDIGSNPNRDEVAMGEGFNFAQLMGLGPKPKERKPGDVVFKISEEKEPREDMNPVEEILEHPLLGAMRTNQRQTERN